MVPKEASFVSGRNRRQVDERTIRAPKMAGGIPACSFTVPMYMIKGAIVVPICKICIIYLKFCYQYTYNSNLFTLLILSKKQNVRFLTSVEKMSGV